MVGQVLEVVLPIPLLPEAETFSVRVGVSHWNKAVDLPLQVQVPQLLNVSPDHLVGINEDDLGHIQGEEHVQKKHLVGPNEPLFLALGIQPAWPLVGNKGHVKIVPTAHLWGKSLELRRQEIVDEPEMQRKFRVVSYRQNHDPQQLFIEM